MLKPTENLHFNIMAAAIADARLRRCHLKVLAEVVGSMVRADPEWPTIDEITQRTGLAPRSIENAMSELSVCGYVERRKGRRRGCDRGDVAVIGEAVSA